MDITKIKNFEDLTNPSFKGKVCLRNRKSPYNQSLVSNQIAKKGVGQTKIWLKGLISNVSTPYFSGDSSLIRAVGQGTCGIGPMRIAMGSRATLVARGIARAAA